jgi:hypothetical protein
MTDPYLVPCLAVLRAEFNALNPKRYKGSDGWIGDTAHQSHTSDHNPQPDGRVLALDVDSTGPWPGIGVTDFNAFNMMVESVRGDARLEYVIWNRRIASRDRGWTWRTYTGTSDPHTGHAHFSARHDHTGNTSTKEWGIEAMAIADDVAKISSQVEYNRKVLGNIQLALNAIAGKVDADPVDEQQIVSGVLAGLSPEAIAAAVPADLARQVADELAKRLAA